VNAGPMEPSDGSAETPLPASPNGTAAVPAPAASATKPVLYGFLVDTEKCIGSGKCLSACRTENHVPEGYSRTWVERYVHFNLTLDGREGLVAAIVVLTLPLLALFAASRLLPLIAAAEPPAPPHDLCKSMPLDVCTSHQ
jgi:hypothetical protein